MQTYEITGDELFCLRYVDRNGCLTRTTYQNRLKNGEETSYDRNGRLMEKCYYKDGIKNGEETRYDVKGSVMTRCYYKDGNYDTIYYYRYG